MLYDITQTRPSIPAEYESLWTLAPEASLVVDTLTICTRLPINCAFVYIWTRNE